jgi:hypothetical protein
MQTSRLSRRSVGQFDPNAWLKEGDGLVASAKETRGLWQSYRKEFSATVRERKAGGRDANLDWNRLTGLPRASMLLLGYSVEMYLKAGLAKAYFGCSEEMFTRDVKGKFGHRLVSIAHEIAFALKAQDEPNLDLLKEMVLVDARYPISVDEGATYTQSVNEQTSRIWSEEKFNSFLELANRIREHSSKIDQDSQDPANYGVWNIDDDGYLAFRCGGRLPPRITYRVSTVEKENGKDSLDDLKCLFASPEFTLLNRCWNRAWIYEDGETPNGTKKTYERFRPDE